MSIEAIFFDVGGTLVEVSPSVGHVYAGECARRGAVVDPERIQQAFDTAWVSLSAGVPPGVDRYRMLPGGEREWWERVATAAFDLCGVPVEARPPVESLRDVFARADAWRVYPEVRGTLERLSRRGHRLGVISNWDSRLPRLLASLELDTHFEAVVYSAAAGFEKPHPEIFAAALSHLGVEPSRAAHIGDRLDEDYAGARGAGLRAVLLSRGPARPELIRKVRACGDEEDVVGDLAQAVDRLVG